MSTPTLRISPLMLSFCLCVGVLVLLENTAAAYVLPTRQQILGDLADASYADDVRQRSVLLPVYNKRWLSAQRFFPREPDAYQAHIRREIRRSCRFKLCGGLLGS